MCVMEQFDKATFAQVPLEAHGHRGTSRRSGPGQTGRLQGGVQRSVAAGEEGLGYYLPFRFALGNPFHAGIPWKGMEVGLKGMSSLMAK